MEVPYLVSDELLTGLLVNGPGWLLLAGVLFYIGKVFGPILIILNQHLGANNELTRMNIDALIAVCESQKIDDPALKKKIDRVKRVTEKKGKRVKT